MKNEKVQDEQLDELKASYGVNASVAEPHNVKVKARKGDKLGTEYDPEDSPTAVKPSIPPEVSSKKAAVKESKMSMIQAIIEKMNGMKKEDLAASFAAIEEAIDGTSESEITEKKSFNSNLRISADDIDVADHVDALFNNDSSLTEEFKEKATTIFEAAVVTKVNEELAKIVADIESQINEERQSIVEDMSAKLDQYLDYVVEQWMEENKLAVQHGVRTELVDSFITGLKDLFAEHYIDVPEDQIDVLEEVAAKAEELEEQLDTQIKINMELKSEIQTLKKEEIIREVAESLTDTQFEKFLVLAEGVEFSSEKKYAEKLNVIKKSYFSESNETANGHSDFDDAVPLIEETQTRVNPEMSAYLNAISRTSRK